MAALILLFLTLDPGYHGGPGEGDGGVLQRTMEAVRQEAERQDYYGGTVLLHSLSGGTGSGETRPGSLSSFWCV